MPRINMSQGFEIKFLNGTLTFGPPDKNGWRTVTGSGDLELGFTVARMDGSNQVQSTIAVYRKPQKGQYLILTPLHGSLPGTPWISKIPIMSVANAVGTQNGL